MEMVHSFGDDANSPGLAAKASHDGQIGPTPLLTSQQSQSLHWWVLAFSMKVDHPKFAT